MTTSPTDTARHASTGVTAQLCNMPISSSPDQDMEAVSENHRHFLPPPSLHNPVAEVPGICLVCLPRHAMATGKTWLIEQAGHRELSLDY